MTELPRKLAKIEKANLEIKERGILTFWIYVNYEDFGSQGIGGLALDTYVDKKSCRVGTAYGCEMIRRLLLIMDVNDLSEMTGKHIWVYGEEEGFAFKPLGINRLRIDGGGDEPLFFADVLEETK